MVIFDDMDDLVRPQGSYPESFLSLYLFLAYNNDQWQTTNIRVFVMVKKRHMRQTNRQTDKQTLEKFNIDSIIPPPHTHKDILDLKILG